MSYLVLSFFRCALFSVCPGGFCSALCAAVFWLRMRVEPLFSFSYVIVDFLPPQYFVPSSRRDCRATLSLGYSSCPREWNKLCMVTPLTMASSYSWLYKYLVHDLRCSYPPQYIYLEYTFYIRFVRYCMFRIVYCTVS